jgi:hypothetical protein
VSNLHVLEDLREAEGTRTQHEAHRSETEVQKHSTGRLASIRGADYLADVLEVALAQIGNDFLSERVELAAERIGLLAR